VKVFSLNPGPVLTPMNERNRASAAGHKWYPGMKQTSFLPAEKAAGYVVFLASGQGDALAGRYVQVFDDLDQLAAEAVLRNDDAFLTLRIAR
jgi:NAD(P)-dependent dehydrogenase (short-subunit alcohol dehydrogenase family)